MRLEPVFTDTLPSKLEKGKLYISVECKLVAHSCCCGCGTEVHTPLTPRDWEMRYNGAEVSLWPSIGGWSAKCRSHYIIKENEVIWAGKMSKAEIERGRKARRYAGRGKMSRTRKVKWGDEREETGKISWIRQLIRKISKREN